MCAPDGTNYPKMNVFKEIISFHKIVLEHFNPHFITTVFFESKDDETQIDWTLLFDTIAMFEPIVIAHQADRGQEQNTEKLEKCLFSRRRESIEP